VAVGALEAVVLIVFWSWAFTAVALLRYTVIPRLPLTMTPASFDLSAETVRFHATDGLELEGWLIPSHADRPWVIVCHGLGANRADVLPIAAGLHGAGLNLFLFDFRGHGASRGRVSSFGWIEQRDLEGALAFLGRRPEIPARPYGIYGISMGGAVALMVAGHDERLGAIAVESPYADLDASLRHHLRLLYPWLPSRPFHWFAIATYRLRFGAWPRRMSPERAAAHLGSRPLLVIHNEHDPRIPRADIQRLIGRVTGPKELWMSDGGGHLESFASDPEAYVARLARFFEAWWKTTSPHQLSD
jgi:fermentation-respiration switch protein FrsA (DUF1100 family)